MLRGARDLIKSICVRSSRTASGHQKPAVLQSVDEQDEDRQKRFYSLCMLQNLSERGSVQPATTPRI